MFCSRCGANNADIAIHCVQCGAALRQAVPVPVPATGQPVVHVENYLVFAILVTILCCLPAGVVAIVYAAQVNSKLQIGDIVGAQQSSKNAKLWCLISAGAAVVLGVGYMLLVLLIGIGSLGGNHF